MRVSYWVKYLNNNARRHPESRRRRGISQSMLCDTLDNWKGHQRLYARSFAPLRMTRYWCVESIRAADPAGFRPFVLSPVLCATLQSRHDFRKARPPALSNREILPGACTAELRVIRD